MKCKKVLSTVLTAILVLTALGAAAGTDEGGCLIYANPEVQSTSNPLSSRIDNLLTDGESVFLFFYADWCPFCHEQMPIIDELEVECAGEVTFIRINVTERPDHAGEFGVSALPTAIVISGKDGGEYLIKEISGFAEEAELSEIIAPGGGADGGVRVTASSIKCNSCADCTKKLNGEYDMVMLTTDLTNIKGSCITFGANNVVFDGDGHTIDGDDLGEFESGITMNGKTGNTIKNCGITDFESGISLYASSKNEMYDNEISSNYYDGIWISDSDSNNIHDNLIEDNGKYGVYFASDSNGNTFSENTVCSNPIDIYDADKNSGDENACDTAHNWNDAGTQGCTHDCTVKKPDLLITDIRNDDGTICYEIKNIGDATAQNGHYTTLFIDGVYQIKEQVDVDLAPGASSERYFEYYSWECTSPENVVEVCTDYGDFVDESNEENNCLNETWTCASPGGAIIYHADYGAGIWQMNPDGSGNTQLSDHGWFAEHSPDNTKIAFGEYYQSGIWVMDSDGTDQVQLTSSGNAPTWSPDGTKIAYHVGGAVVTDRRIWVMDAGGSNAQKLSDNPGDFPAWSPDGTKIAYGGEVDDDIWLIHPDGTGETQLCASGAYPAWSPIGEKIAYRSLTDGCIWTVNADGSDKVKISTHTGRYPTWSPDGTKIAYEDVANKMGIWVIDADGTDEHLINQGGHAPDWMSPGIVEELPDLVITDVWEDGGICYQIRNIGDGAAPKGYHTSLVIDDKESVSDLIDSELKPGERLKRCFNYGWQCSPPDDGIAVCADQGDDVDEASEGNNYRNERWKCDNTPPVIVSGPVVSGITQSSVTISWTTDEDSDSLVRFGRTAGAYEDQKSSLKLTQEHTIILTDLLPSTTYHYVVKSIDSSGNTINSKDNTFETLPLPDEENPNISIKDIGTCRGITKITAQAFDNIGVERVEFYIEDELVFTDYSSPFDFLLNTTEYVNGDYTLRARASDLSGRIGMGTIVIKIFNQLPDIFSPSLEIITPDDGDTVSETTIISARATDARGMDRIEFYIDDGHVHTRVSPSPERESLYSSFFWDTYEVDNGLHDIRVVAYDAAGNDNQDTVTITVDNIGPCHRPDMVVRRESMTLDGSTFTIRLDVHNAGDRDANNVEIVDHLVGFQPTGREPSGWDLTSEFDPSTKECAVTFRASHRFRPGVGTDVVYDIVPILTEEDILYQVGTSTSVSFDGVEGDHYDEELSIPTWVIERPSGISWHLVAAVDHAFRNADYLIVTNPSRLFSHYTDADVEELLSSMAGLAEGKNGVPGYLDTHSRSAFKDLIEPEGDWSSRLRDDWTSEGYLLIVGETEIVPSRDIYDTGIRDTTAVDFSSGPVYPVTCVDNHYADISGSDNLPELIVGRIIGDSAEQLMTPIETSLLDQFERTDALVVSGIGTGQDSFETNADEVADILDDEFTVDQMYGSDYANDAQRLTQFRNRARDKDVLYYRDHGSIDGWSRTVFTSDFPVDFGGSYPLAFGMVCLAGNYERGDDYNIAEAFLDSNTGVYIGATEPSSRSRNNPTGKKFFGKWVNSPISIGRALKETKRELDVSDDKYRLWVMEYNLYGDPKYGASSATNSLTSIAYEAPQPPLPSLEVTIPDYEVTPIAGLDHVEIPEGQLLLVTDEPIVPYYAVSVDYANGYNVLDVILAERSGLVTATGLNLPTVIEGAGEDGSEEAEMMGEFTNSGWYPEEEYRWQIIENPNGSTTLLVMMYPFYYNQLTTDARFYKNYKFEISYTTSTVEIAALRTDKDVYQQGDDVLVNLWLKNSGDAKDVFVDAVVKAGGSGKVASGLLLQTLKGFEGLASFSPQWDSIGVDPGYYFVEVTLKDTSGDVLDRKTEMFRLGISSGEIASFTAAPEYFESGDEIEMKMTFRNNGTVNVTGTAIIKVLNSTGDVVEWFRHNVTSLTPSGSISFSDAWDSSGAEAGSSYRIIGYVLYDSKSTDPATVTVQNIIMGDLNRDGEVTTADAAIALEIAARGEWCADADVNNDHKVTSLDALMILQAAAGNIELQGCETLWIAKNA